MARKSSYIVAVLLLGLAAAQVRGQATIAYTFDGDSSGDQFGSSVSGAGDVNGDGFDDVIVGAFGADNNGSGSGSARVLSGLDGSILYTFDGDSASDQFGRSVSGAGDVNGDGFGDVIVGAPGDDNNGSGSGSARVYSGLDGSILYAFDGDSADDFFGTSVSGAGDVNGDGFDDVVVGANGDDNNGSRSGSARVFSGLDGSVLYTFNGDSTDDFLGFSVSGAGDVNNDGFHDVIVGAYGDDNNGSESGSARVLSGLDGSTLYTFDGGSLGEWFGYSVSGAGDVNGDGFDDIIVGALNDDNNGSQSGSARVFSGLGGNILYAFDGDSFGDQLGRSVSGAGDVNGDGFDDVIVGAWRDDNNAFNSGSARVLSGLDGTILHSFDGDSSNDRFGWSVSGAGDINGDGFGDFIVGAPGDDNNGSFSGSARVFTSPTFPVLNYDSDQGNIRLTQTWTPNGGDINSVVGTISCVGATPGALGLVGVSLAPADILIFGFPLLIATDPTNLTNSAGFGFDIMGELHVANVSRLAPFLAGSFAHIQFFETSPIISCSNGIRLELVP